MKTASIKHVSCPGEHLCNNKIPNQKTVAMIALVEKKCKLVRASNAQDFFKKLGI